MINRISLFLKKEIIVDFLIVIAGSIIVGLSNLFYQLISIRLLSPEDFGTFNALTSLIMFSSITISPLGTTFTRFFTEYATRENFTLLFSFFIKTIKILLVLSLVIFICFFVCAPFIAKFLKTRIIYVVVSGIIIILSLFSSPVTSFVQGFQKFKTLSFINIVSSFGKLFGGSIIMLLGWGVLGGLSGFLIGALIIFLVSFFIIPTIFRKKLGKINCLQAINLSSMYKYLFPVSLCMLAFTLLTNIDALLVKHMFCPLDAGYYSIAQMVGKIFLFLPSAFVIVIFPKTTQAYIKKSNSCDILYKSLLLTAPFCIIGILFCFLFPNLVLMILTGKTNSVSSQLVSLFALSMSFYSLLWIEINYLLAMNNLKFIVPLTILSFLQASSIYLFHVSLVEVALTILIYSILTFGVTSYSIIKNNHE